MVGIGGFFVMGGGYLPGTIPQALGAASVLLAFVNVSGGFVITKRMLDMFKSMYHSSIFQTPTAHINASQDQLTLPSTPGFGPYLVSYSVVASLPPLQPVLQDLYRLATS